jgi:hypothetical protein
MLVNFKLMFYNVPEAQVKGEELGVQAGSPGLLCHPLVVAAFSLYATGLTLFPLWGLLYSLICLHSHLVLRRRTKSVSVVQ